MLAFRALAALFALLSFQAALAQPVQTGATRAVLERVAGGLQNPWGLAFIGEGRMLVTEKPGRLRVVEPDGRLSPPVEGVPKVWASGQGGLLDVAIAPDFGRSRVIYFSYAEPREGGAATTLASAQLNEARTALTNLKVLFRQQPASNGPVHFGSRIVVARDGNIFLGLGDRGRKEMAQDLGAHQGKVVRIRPDGSVPADNPYVSRAGALKDIWTHGHRNIQGAALHPQTGQLWTVEHGAQGGDEINVPKAGRNYGWPVITYGTDYGGGKIGVGTHQEGMAQPIHYWDPSIAPSGMMFYTGDKFPAWRGSVFVGALRGSLVSRLTLEGEKVTGEERLLSGHGHRFRDIRQGPDGNIYLLTDASNGQILRLRPE
jgi:glucose/arabinose dehydrogenase